MENIVVIGGWRNYGKSEQQKQIEILREKLKSANSDNLIAVDEFIELCAKTFGKVDVVVVNSLSYLINEFPQTNEVEIKSALKPTPYWVNDWRNKHGKASRSHKKGRK